MYYLLYFLKDDPGIADVDRKVRRFKTAAELLKYVDHHGRELDVDRVVKTEKEFSIAWKANLTELSFAAGPNEKTKGKRGPYKKRQTPEEALEKADKVIEEAKKTSESKCSKCGIKIAAWDKTGICGNCQQGKKTKKNK